MSTKKEKMLAKEGLSEPELVFDIDKNLLDDEWLNQPKLYFSWAVQLEDARDELEQKTNATIYLGEDQPYAGLADKNDWDIARSFLNALPLIEINYPVDTERKSDLLMKHYPSQVEESYREGILNRAEQLRQEYGSDTGVECIYRLEP